VYLPITYYRLYVKIIENEYTERARFKLKQTLRKQ
jgi:hypothetical protein